MTDIEDSADHPRTTDWGPEIRVAKKRPEWLTDGVPMRWAGVAGSGKVIPYMAVQSQDCVNWNPAGNGCYIRLPADHPHYRQPVTPERDPTLWGRMEALVVMMARIPCSRKYPKGVFGHEARYAFDEARDIAARLTTDPDIVEAIQIARAALAKDRGEQA